MAGHWRRRILLALAALLGIAVLSAATVVGLTQRTLGRHYDISPAAIVIPTDSASLERGRHLATAITKCTECHGDDLGGTRMALGPVGSFSAVNLTAGRGGVAPLSDADWVRAIRHGVNPKGEPLVFMPSGVFAHLSDADLAAIIAWVRSMPPVDRELPGREIGPVGRVLIATNPGRLVPAAALDHDASPPAAVPAAPTAEYGRYLVRVGGCEYCHGENLKGGIKEGPPGTPASADLTSTGRLAQWNEADFHQALRSGVRPDGTLIDPFMPWKATRLMTDDEITAVWLYLKTF